MRRAYAAAAGITLAGIAGTLAYACRAPGSQLFGRTLVAPPHADQIALTFDDGPNPAATGRLLEVLARHKVRATFFLIGRFVLREPALAREIAAAGHVIGNHSMTHPFLPRLSAAHIRDELTACNHILEHTLDRPVELFRPPFGARRPAVLRAAQALGLETVQWNLIAGDWRPITSDRLHRRLKAGLARNQAHGRGTNLVLHDGGDQELGADRMSTVAAIDLLLSRLKRREETIRFLTPLDWDEKS